jgi:hypothetical protein
VVAAGADGRLALRGPSGWRLASIEDQLPGPTPGAGPARTR